MVFNADDGVAWTTSEHSRSEGVLERGAAGKLAPKRAANRRFSRDRGL
jgi:hypothetical protein